jgi:hypothetical protein
MMMVVFAPPSHGRIQRMGIGEPGMKRNETRSNPEDLAVSPRVSAVTVKESSFGGSSTLVGKGIFDAYPID